MQKTAIPPLIFTGPGLFSTGPWPILAAAPRFSAEGDVFGGSFGPLFKKLMTRNRCSIGGLGHKLT
jgi:hypothetical protein